MTLESPAPPASEWSGDCAKRRTMMLELIDGGEGRADDVIRRLTAEHYFFQKRHVAFLGSVAAVPLRRDAVSAWPFLVAT
jgi:hypothetical protein